MPKATSKSIRKPTVKKTPSKPDITERRFFKPTMITIGAILFGLVGAYVLRHPYALDQNGVPNDPTQLVLEIQSPDHHALAPDVMPDYDPPSMLLFGDGLLVCGDTAASKKDIYNLKTGHLTPDQITDLVDRVTRQGAKSKEEQDHAQKLSTTRTIEETTQIFLNYNSGAVGLRATDNDTTPAFKNIHGVLTSTCARYAKEDFRADQYVVRTQAVDPASVADLPEVASTVTAVNPAGSYTESTVSLDQADQLITAMSGARNARLVASDKTYQVQVNPVMPTHSAITVTTEHDDDIVSAASDLKTLFIWFYPDGASLSGLNDQTDNIHGGSRSFFQQETGRLNSTAGNQVVHGLHGVAWYNGCHASTPTANCSSSEDLNAWYNVQNELRSRGLMPLNTSVNVLAQWQSQHGSRYCSGWGTVPSSIGSSTGGFALTAGFGSTNWGCQSSGWDGKFTVPAHEMGHTFGLDHACSSSPNNAIMCLKGDFSWPGGYTITNSTQTSGLKAYSLFLNHQISGRVYYQSTGAAATNVSVSTCRSDIAPVTNAGGYFSFRLFTDGGYCVRITPPAGYVVQTKNNAEHATATTYEYQLAGRNCYKQPVSDICTTPRTTWDMSSDSGKDFVLVKQ